MINYQILGGAGRDNAVWCRVETGQNIQRLLFDCGSHCISRLGVAEARDVDIIFFSHLHIDHIAGFDDLFRLTFNRMVKPNIIYGPEFTAQIIQHRMQGFRWSHVDGHPARWWLHDIFEDSLEPYRLNLGERFEHLHAQKVKNFSGWLELPDFRVRVFHLNHGTIPSLGYLVQERSKHNIAKDKLAKLGLSAGAWLQQVKDTRLADSHSIEHKGTSWRLGDLRRELLLEKLGASLAYLSDFYLSDEEIPPLAKALHGCDTLICESQYLPEDESFALKNAHMTCARAAQLAKAAQVNKLILFHVSERYDLLALRQMLEEARAIFANTHFPPHWRIS